MGIKYEPSIGIQNLAFCVVLGRPGSASQTRNAGQAARGANRISKGEAKCWFQQKEGGIILPGKYISVSLQKAKKMFSAKWK